MSTLCVNLKASKLRPYRGYTEQQSETPEGGRAQGPAVGNTLSDDEIEKLTMVSRVQSVSKGIRYFRDGLGLEPVVPELIRLIAEPGFENFVDDSRIFHTLFEDPTLDPLMLAERIWAENRPPVLSQMAYAPSETIKGTQDATTTTENDSFRLLDLPGELRNRVYLHMLRPTVCLKDLTGQVSDWFNPAILCTSRQINAEVSSVIYKQQITVVLDPMAMACCKKGLHKLPEKSRFTRCGVDIDLSDPRLTMVDRDVTVTLDAGIKVAEMVHLLVEDLKEMRFLEELHLSCRRATLLKCTLDDAGFAIHEDTLLFPDSTMDCFRKLKGLKKVVVEGDLGGEYVAGLLRYMNKPHVDLTTTGSLVGVVRRSHCKACSWPKENYIQVADPPSRPEFHYPSNPGHIFDVRYPDRS